MARPVEELRSITIDDLFDFGHDVIKREQEGIPHPIEWMESHFIDPISKKLVQLQPHQKRILRRALHMDKDGYSKYSLVIWSEPKKSGKTTVAAAVAAYVAECIESPNEVSCLANDKEQSAGRIYANMVPTLERLGWQVPLSERGKRDRPAAYGPNGSVVKAITTDYEKEAGANQGISLWSELWAYDSERLNRLWEEMTPPPTRKFAMRWVETYAGFIGESRLLWSYYNRVFKTTEEKELQDRVVQLWKDLPVYEIDERTLVYWSHEPRMPWQTRAYYNDQKKNMRYSSYIRLHENKWVEAAGDFITIEMWDNSVRSEKPAFAKATYALDASKNGACTALVGCAKIPNSEGVQTVDVHIWEPEEGDLTSGKEVDYRDIENTIVKLWKEGRLRPPLWYDPYQCAKLAQDLRAKGIPCQEFPQSAMRVKADTFLYKLYKEGTIVNYSHPTLRRHILNAKEKRYDGQKCRIMSGEGDDEFDTRSENASEANQWRTVYVDAAVAQSMAAYKAYLRPEGGWTGAGW